MTKQQALDIFFSAEQKLRHEFQEDDLANDLQLARIWVKENSTLKPSSKSALEKERSNHS